MTQYLIQEFTDSTGYIFTHVVKASDNERYTVVNADSESEALAIAKDLMQCLNCESWKTEHEYMYADNTPVYLHFMSHDCESAYVCEVEDAQCSNQ